MLLMDIGTLKLKIQSNIYSSSKIKYLGANLNKYAQDLYGENYKALMTEIKELNKWRHTMFMD